MWKLPVPCYVTRVYRSFCGEKLQILAVYIQNRCPHSALDSKTPEEVFTGKKPDVSHFRIFGCPVYFHVPKEKRSKLDASGKKGMFVGYSETSKAYRVYVPGQREVEIGHDVTFDEDASLKKVVDLPRSQKKIMKKGLEIKKNHRMRQCLMLKDQWTLLIHLLH